MHFVPLGRGRTGSSEVVGGIGVRSRRGLTIRARGEGQRMDATTPEADGPELPWSRRALHGARRKTRAKSVSPDRKSPGAGCLASHFPPLLRRSGKTWTARRRGVPRHLFFNRHFRRIAKVRPDRTKEIEREICMKTGARHEESKTVRCCRAFARHQNMVSSFDKLRMRNALCPSP